MVQILPQAPSLAELLGGGISQGVSSGMQGRMQLNQALKLEKQKQQMKQEQLQNILSGLGLVSTPGSSQMQPEMPSEMISQNQMPTSKNAQVSQLEKIATNPQAMAALSAVQPQMADQITKMYANQLQREKFELSKQKELRAQGILPESKKEEYADLANQVENLMKQNPWHQRVITPLSEGGTELNALGEQMFAAIRDKVVKGNMSKSVFDYIKNNVTVRARDTDAQIKGKLNAFRRYAKVLKEGKDYSNFTIDDAKKIIGKKNAKEIGSQELQIGQTATNPKTGEKIEWTGTNWRKVK